MEERKWVKRKLDKNQQMLLFGRKKKKKGRKIWGKKSMWGPHFFILPILDEKLFSTHLCIKLPCYLHFKILIIKYMNKIVNCLIKHFLPFLIYQTLWRKLIFFDLSSIFYHILFSSPSIFFSFIPIKLSCTFNIKWLKHVHYGWCRKHGHYAVLSQNLSHIFMKFWTNINLLEIL